MSKTRSLRLFAYSITCDMENVISLLKNAGWSVTDKNGDIHHWNTETDEWEIFSGIYERFVMLPKCCFKAFSDGMSVDVFVDGGKSFDITLEPKYTAVGKELVFDFNWYYDSLVNRINDSSHYVIERVIFDEF